MGKQQDHVAEALERMGATWPESHSQDLATIRAHIEGLEARVTDALAVTNMLVLCGEREVTDVAGLPDKLRALIDGLIVQRRRAEAAEARVRELEAWRDAVFDGPAVYDQLTEDAKRRTGPENVSDTLDAVAKVAMQASREGR